jgi:hypothetical protein
MFCFVSSDAKSKIESRPARPVGGMLYSGRRISATKFWPTVSLIFWGQDKKSPILTDNLKKFVCIILTFHNRVVKLIPDWV